MWREFHAVHSHFQSVLKARRAEGGLHTAEHCSQCVSVCVCVWARASDLTFKQQKACPSGTPVAHVGSGAS